MKDSNSDLKYSTYMASRLGFEPRMLILEIKVLPITLSRHLKLVPAERIELSQER